MSRTMYLVLVFLMLAQYCFAQTDSALQAIGDIQKIPVKYINDINNKVDRYSRRITSKTENTLAKLSRWENKIQMILQKVDPGAALKLFGDDQTTFGTLLKKIKEGKAIAENYKTRYDEYRDKLTGSLKYLQQQKDNLKSSIVKPLTEVNKKLTALEQDISNTESVEQFIKERRKQLLDEAVKYIGSSRYLTKINKESYYYIETLRNYKEIFSDKKKAEETVLALLNKIPAFQKFVQENSILASLFRMPGNGSNNVADLAGLQTRASVQSLVQDRIASGGPGAQAVFSQNLQQAQDELYKFKDKVIKAGQNSSDAAMPDFKPNQQRSKTFFQRLQFGSNFQFAKSNSLVPAIADIGVQLGYKLNEKSIVGLGLSYKMGIGSFQHINITHQGIGIRSFIDWKLKNQFFISGGYEMNYNAQFRNIPQLTNYSEWQQAGLIGLTKKLDLRTKFFKTTKLQLLYDILYRRHVPVSQPVLFRVEYDLK